MEDNKPVACRKKEWSEKSVGEQVEELKRELYRTQCQVKSLCQYVGVLLKHEHSGNHIVRPIVMSNDCEEDSGSLYFRINDFK